MFGALNPLTKVHTFWSRAFASAATATPVYVVLGATGGIGAEVCGQLASSGSQLAIGGRNPEKLDALIAAYPHAQVSRVDATNSKEVEAFIQKAVATYGRVDGVVNCVGSVLLKPAHTTTDDEFNEVINTNLFSAFCAVKAAVKVMSKQSPKGGSIVLCSSAVAQTGLPNHEAIAAAKAGIVGLARSAAATYAGANIRVNCVAPGLTRTPMTARITGNETALKMSTSMHALGRIAEADEVARAIVFLMDPKNSFITGQVLGVDGGLGSLKGK
eukprot:CAMPEP_0198206658 /NCGR_PEP_ID=MMETSP1445-20131203/10204_1 /TAXON_ID=36898 /ORGANISM="Pyramimonas sp., Strain CCMP2087" /LENGTH=271 /DNA_ID=CAMNT_0043879435 /DNA_START=1 /DNA_END=816 /DNA_ORIENTATION=-